MNDPADVKVASGEIQPAGLEDAASPSSQAQPESQSAAEKTTDAAPPPSASNFQPAPRPQSAELSPPPRDHEPLPSFDVCRAALDPLKDKQYQALDRDKRTLKDLVEALTRELGQSCKGLAPVLQSSAVTTALETYEAQNQIAIGQQEELKREANRAYLCLLAAGVTSGLILVVSKYVAPTDQPGDGWKPLNLLVLALGLVTLLLGAAAAFFEFLVRDQDRFGRWRRSRGAAEIARLNVFSSIASGAAENDGSEVDGLYALALVVRHLLDDQRTWMRGRAEKHRESSVKTSRWGGLASGLAFLGGSGAIIASQLPNAVFIVLAGVLGAAVGAFATNRESLNRDRANADRYEKTAIALDGVRARTDDVVAQIEAGKKQAVVIFTQTVTDLLAAEHKQWLEGSAQAEAALQKLDAQLEALRGESRAN